MAELELVPENTPLQDAPAQLYQELLGLAEQWDKKPTGDYLPNGFFESQLDAQDLRAWILRVSQKHDHAQVLASAMAFMREPNRAGREHDLKNLLRPYLPAPESRW